MKILYIVNVAAPYRVDFFNELGKSTELTVFFEKSKVINRNKKWYKSNYINFKSVTNEKNGTLSGIIILLKLLYKDNYDEIVLGGYSTKIGMVLTLLFKIMNKRYILNIDGGILKSESKIKRIIKSFFISSADRWLCPGEKSIEYLKHYGAVEEKIYIYPFTSISTNDILSESVSLKEKMKIKTSLEIKEEVVIVFVGRFIESKGIKTLLKSINNYDNVGLYIIGGKATPEYLEIVKDRGLINIYFLDFITTETLNKYYTAGDIFVLPTQSDVWGLVINEAMAKGLPIITTNSCNAGVELINDYENGFLIEPDNKTQLKNKIDILVKNNELRKKISENNLKKISEYTVEKMSKATYECFESIK